MTKKELKYVNSLKEENERVKNNLICFMDALGKVRNIDDIESISLIPLMTELNKGIRAEIKAEAYKECIEKVKEKSTKINECHNHVVVRTDYQISGEALDNLLKELVGDN